MKKYLIFIWLISISVFAEIRVEDDAGRIVHLQKPAHRIITMAPHLTEFLFAIGGGGRIVGATSYSNYPDAAKSLVQVGDNRQVDIERVLALRPDLLIVWKDGSTGHQLKQLESLGIPVYYSSINNLDDISETMIRLGRLTGLENQAQKKADEIRNRFHELTRKYSGKTVLRVFYQVSEKPLYTLNGRHIISHVIRFCGGQNVFSDSKILAPNVGIEAVLEKNPEVIFSSDTGGKVRGGVDFWTRFRMLDAVRYKNLFEINPDLLDRPGPRLVEGTEILCRHMEEARRNAGFR